LDVIGIPVLIFGLGCSAGFCWTSNGSQTARPYSSATSAPRRSTRWIGSYR